MQLIAPLLEGMAMEAESWLGRVCRCRVIAVIRSPQLATGVAMARAVVAGGVDLVEVTWNSDRPAELIRYLRHELPNTSIGAGTLLTEAHLLAAIEAGAQFLFTPHVNRNLIQLAVDRHVPLVAGALTPTEIVTAWQAGAAAVKVFPVQAVGGADYIRSLQAPLGEIPLIPTGGVTIASTPEFLQAGAIAVGLSSDLFPRQAIEAGQWQEVTQRSAALMQQLGTQKSRQGDQVSCL